MKKGLPAERLNDTIFFNSVRCQTNPVVGITMTFSIKVSDFYIPPRLDFAAAIEDPRATSHGMRGLCDSTKTVQEPYLSYHIIHHQNQEEQS